MKKHFLPLTSAALVLFACLNSGSGGGGGNGDPDPNPVDPDPVPGTFSTQYEIQILGIIPPQGGNAGKVITREIDGGCDSTGTAVLDTFADTSSYAILGGKLYIWHDGNCRVDVALSGPSSTITGTWTATTMDFVDPVPEAFRPDDCEPDDSGEEGLELAFLEGVAATYVVSETKIQASLSGRLCYARAMAFLMGAFSGDSAMDTASFGCTEAKLVNGAGDTAVFASDYLDGRATLEFAYGDSTCAFASDLDLSPAALPTCSGDEGGSIGEGFLCIAGSGFFGEFEGGFAKAAPVSGGAFRAALEKAVPPPFRPR